MNFKPYARRLYLPFTKRVQELKQPILEDRIKRFANRLIDNEDEVIDEVLAHHRAMYIRKSVFSYDFLNISYLKEICSLILYALYHRCIPIIVLNEGDSSRIQWSWFFESPAQSMFGLSEAECMGLPSIECRTNRSPFSPQFDDVYNFDSEKIRIWRYIFQKFVVFNPKTKAYMNKELSKTMQETLGNGVIGTIIRGTDYVNTRPKGHPIQPSVDMLASEIRQCVARNGIEISSVFVASEERRLVERIGACLREYRMLENSRLFFDNIYYENNYSLIGDVHFDIEDENYWRSMQYLSSLFIITNCDIVVAANSGAVQYCCYMIDDLKKVHIINLGCY